MDIQNYINIIWRRKFVILLALIATMTVVVIGTRRATPVYQASSTLRIAVSAGASMNYSDYMYADRLMNTYVVIATSRPVLEEVANRLGLGWTPGVGAEIISNTELIKITVANTNPSTAATIANTLADVLISQSKNLFIGGSKSQTEVLWQQLDLIQDDLEKTRHEYEDLLAQTPAPEGLDSTRQQLQIKQSNYATLLAQYEQARFREEIQSSMVTVFERAVIPTTPSKPNVLLNMALGFIVGLVGGLGLALLFENLDTTLYEIEEIESVTKLHALGKIPKAKKRQLSTFQENFSPFAEAFRSLATTIQVTHHQQSKKVLLLVSAEPNQGKSMISFHLAHSLAEYGKNVVVVDCDTRAPRLHIFFDLPNQIGLKDVLEQRAGLENALQKSSYEGVQVLTSGSQLARPSQVLGSVQMAKLVKSLGQKFDYVLLDSPAMLAVADVAALVPNVDGLILVVRQSHAQKEAVQETSRFLAEQNGKFTGLIVNQVANSSQYDYYKPRNKLISLLDLGKRFSRKKK